MTLRAGEPDRVVTATVVRVIAAVSGPAASRARVTTGRMRAALAMSGRTASGACGAIRRNSSIVASGVLAGSGERSSRRIALARRAVGPIRAGVAAWPPRPSTRSSREVVPFSVTPMAPIGAATPGNAWCATAPPSSRTNHGRTPRRTSSATAFPAAPPETSSSQPKESQTSWAGVNSRSSRVSTASQIATRLPLSSRVPRPQIAPSTIVASNGGCCQGASPSAGTTSRCAIRTTGRSSRRPGQRNSRPWLPTRVSSRAACSRGNWCASSTRKRSNTSTSTSEGSRCETVGIRTSACSFATARACSCRPSLVDMGRTLLGSPASGGRIQP